MVSFTEVVEGLAKNKIFSRVTASGAIGGGMIMLYKYFTASTVNPEVLAVVSAVMAGASVFLFMSEKD